MFAQPSLFASVQWREAVTVALKVNISALSDFEITHLGINTPPSPPIFLFFFLLFFVLHLFSFVYPATKRCLVKTSILFSYTYLSLVLSFIGFRSWFVYCTAVLLPSYYFTLVLSFIGFDLGLCIYTRSSSTVLLPQLLFHNSSSNLFFAFVFAVINRTVQMMAILLTWSQYHPFGLIWGNLQDFWWTVWFIYFSNLFSFYFLFVFLFVVYKLNYPDDVSIPLPKPNIIHLDWFEDNGSIYWWTVWFTYFNNLFTFTFIYFVFLFIQLFKWW